MRYVMRIAEFSESSNLWTHIALLHSRQEYASFSIGLNSQLPSDWLMSKSSSWTVRSWTAMQVSFHHRSAILSSWNGERRFLACVCALVHARTQTQLESTFSTQQHRMWWFALCDYSLHSRMLCSCGIWVMLETHSSRESLMCMSVVGHAAQLTNQIWSEMK